MEVVYLREDGMVVRTYAYQSSRNCPGNPEWMIGNIPLREMKGEILYQGNRLNDEQFNRLMD